MNTRLTKQVQNSEAVARRRMNEVDEQGWAHIHQAARKGMQRSNNDWNMQSFYEKSTVAFDRKLELTINVAEPEPVWSLL